MAVHWHQVRSTLKGGRDHLERDDTPGTLACSFDPAARGPLIRVDMDESTLCSVCRRNVRYQTFGPKRIAFVGRTPKE